jgi:hypothetical protein
MTHIYIETDSKIHESRKHKKREKECMGHLYYALIYLVSRHHDGVTMYALKRRYKSTKG